MFTDAELEIIADALNLYATDIAEDGAYYSEIVEVEDLQDKVSHLIEFGE